MLRGVLAIRGQAAARGYGFIEVEGREDDVFVLGSEVTDEHGGLATRGEWSALGGRAVEVGDVITTGRRDQASNVRLLPVENASTDGAEAAGTIAPDRAAAASRRRTLIQALGETAPHDASSAVRTGVERMPPRAGRRRSAGALACPGTPLTGWGSPVHCWCAGIGAE